MQCGFTYAFRSALRDVEELLAERGVAVTYETIGQWVRRFGPVFAQELRRHGRRPGDKLPNPPALRRVLPNTAHRRHKGLNNRAENSHVPTRQRERRRQRFKSSEQAQQQLVHDPRPGVGDLNQQHAPI